MCKSGLVLGDLSNVALSTMGGIATQSSTEHGGIAQHAIDGDTNQIWEYDTTKKNTLTHTETENNPWWEVQLNAAYSIYQVNVYNREDCCDERILDFVLKIYNGEAMIYDSSITDPEVSKTSAAMYTFYIPGLIGDKVRIEIPRGPATLTVAEVEVLAPALVRTLKYTFWIVIL